MGQRGYAIIIEPGVSDREWDTITCVHCTKVVFLTPGRDPTDDCGGFCMKCMKHICGPCADKGVCSPAIKKIEEYEKKMAARRALLSSMGLT